MTNKIALKFGFGILLTAVGLALPVHPTSELVLGFAFCMLGGFVVGLGINDLIRK